MTTIHSACMFCKTQGNRSDLTVSPCGGTFCTFHVRCATTFIRTNPDVLKNEEDYTFECLECYKSIKFSVKLPTNYEMLRKAKDSIQSMVGAVAKWKILAAYVLFQAIVILFSMVCQVIILSSHGISWFMWLVKLVSYMPEWVPAPESIKALPRIPLFMIEPSIRPYSPETIEVVDFVKSFSFVFFHGFMLVSYLFSVGEEEHYFFIGWVIIDLVSFLVWTWKLQRNFVEHWRRLSADVSISGIGKDSPA